MDWLVCLLLPVVGLIVGLVRFLQKKPTGGKMLAFSAAALVFWLFVRLVVVAARG